MFRPPHIAAAILAAGAIIPSLRAQYWQLDNSFNPVLESTQPIGIAQLAALSDGGVLVSGWNARFIGGQYQGPIVHVTAAGTVDTSFSSTGMAVAIDYCAYPDGRSIVVGELANDPSNTLYICRLLSDGSLDPSFTNVALGGNDINEKVLIQPDGRILVSGPLMAPGGQSNASLIRLNANGGIDPTFNPLGSNCSVADVELQSDGKILVAGELPFSSGSGIFARLNADGTLDPSFSTPFQGNSFNGFYTGGGITQLPSGDILVATSFSVARLTSSGSVDPTYTAALPTPFQSILGIKLVDGTAYFLESVVYNQNLYRLNADGSVDATFLISTPYAQPFAVGFPATWDGTTLYFSTALTSTRQQSRFGLTQTSATGAINQGFNVRLSQPAAPSAITRQPDGRYLAAGEFDYADGVDVSASPLVRLNTDGSLDTSFASSAGASATYFSSLVVQPDGHIVAVLGNTSLTQFNSDGSASSGFPAIPAFAAATDQGGNLYVLANNTSGTAQVLQRYSPAGVVDPTFSAVTGFITGIVGATTDGKVVMTEVTGRSLSLVRITGSGAVDPALSLSFSDADGSLSVCLLPDNGILSAVQGTTFSAESPMVYTRYDSSGNPVYVYDGEPDNLTAAGVLFDQLRATSVATAEQTLSQPYTPYIDVRSDGQATIQEGRGALVRYLRASLTSPSEDTAPVIYAQSAGATVPAGEFWTAEVYAYGLPPLSYQWSRNGVPVPGATASGLFLQNVQPSEAGNYTVFISNSGGSTTSSAVTLAVFVPTPTPRPTPAPLLSPTPSGTPTPTPSRAPTPTPRPSPTARPSPTPSATPAPTPSRAPTPTPRTAPTPRPSPTPTPL